MAVTIPLFWIKLICLSKIEVGSLSKPTINPPCTSRLLFWILFIQAIRSRFLFRYLLHSVRLSSLGVSIPTKTLLNPALTINCISSSSSERFIDASVKKEKGYFFCFIQSIKEGRISIFSLFLLPMKLSSTKNTELLQPCKYKTSNSSKIWFLLFVLGLWPFRTMMSQNSQLKGQPLEYWMHIEAYFFMLISSHSGGGVFLISGRSLEI